MSALLVVTSELRVESGHDVRLEKFLLKKILFRFGLGDGQADSEQGAVRDLLRHVA